MRLIGLDFDFKSTGSYLTREANLYPNHKLDSQTIQTNQMVKKRETKESSEAPSSEPKTKKPSKKQKLETETTSNTSVFQLRPITTLWASEYMKALLTCTKSNEHHHWYNIRVLGNPPQNPLELVIKTFEENLINIKEIVALDLGWNKGEWMIKFENLELLLKLNQINSLNHSRGYFMGNHLKINLEHQNQKDDKLIKIDSPEIEFIITSLSNLFKNQFGKIDPVEIPIVLMGIPFHQSNKINLNHYLFESITAQNRELGIKSVKVKQRYMIGSAQTNDVLCHFEIDSKFLFKWDLEKTMKVIIQGWDNLGIPRPEMWPVTMRYLDECLICGGFYHVNDQDGISIIDCNTLTIRNDLINRREAYNRKLLKTQPPNLITDDSNHSTVKANTARTSIGFIVAT